MPTWPTNSRERKSTWMDKAFHFQRRRTAQAFWIVGIAISLAVGMQMEAIANLPEAKGVQLLWHDNFYDGPVNGVWFWLGAPSIEWLSVEHFQLNHFPWVIVNNN